MNSSIASANNATLATVAATYALKSVVDQLALDVAARQTAADVDQRVATALLAYVQQAALDAALALRDGRLDGHDADILALQSAGPFALPSEITALQASIDAILAEIATLGGAPIWSMLPPGRARSPGTSWSEPTKSATSMPWLPSASPWPMTTGPCPCPAMPTPGRRPMPCCSPRPASPGSSASSADTSTTQQSQRCHSGCSHELLHEGGGHGRTSWPSWGKRTPTRTTSSWTTAPRWR